MEQYFFAKGVEWKSQEPSQRILAVLGGTSQQGAAQWYVMQKQYVTNVDDFFSKVEREFVPADLQERLREVLDSKVFVVCTWAKDVGSKSEIY